MKISKFYFGPGSPKNCILRFFWNFLRGKSGIRESRVRLRSARKSRSCTSKYSEDQGLFVALRREQGISLSWPDSWPVKKIRKTENPLPRAEAAGCRLRLPGSRQPPVRARPGRDRKNSGKILKISFLDSRDQNKILKF